jgi:WD40 repeat protein/tRNA A-37 threonylcarbamoyl transferase component Bud32
MATLDDDSLEAAGSGQAADEQRLLELLASYDDAIAEGLAPSLAERLGGMDAVLADRLQRDEAVVNLLAQAGGKARRATGESRRPNRHAPKQIGRFDIIRELGRGGLGVVFLAHDPVLKRNVALKLPRPEALVSDELRRRFLREARAVARLTHPNLVPALEAAELGPLVYLASDYVEGPTLAAWLAERDEPPPTARSAELVAVLADAVHYAHTQGVVHRDVTPTNIILAPVPAATDHGGSPAGSECFTPKLVDFGLARVEDSNTVETRAGVAMGTLGYMAPEQAQGQLDKIGPPTDIYALGAVLYHLVTGKPPYAGPSAAVSLKRLLSGELVPPRQVVRAIPRDLEAICLKCLEHEPARRYATAGELAADLRRFLAGEATVARPLAPAQRLARWVRRRPTAASLVAVICLAALVILGGSTWYSWQLSDALDASEARRREAVASRAEADSQRRQAAAQRDANEELLYASRMRLANQLLEQREAQEANRTLAHYEDDKPGAALRGFEWHYLRRLLHGERLTLRGHRGEVYAVAFLPDGQQVVSGGADGTIKVWDAATGREVRSIAAHESCTNDLKFSPDGRWLASASCDKTVKLWDPQTWTCEQVFSEPTSEASTLAFSPDGELLVAGCKDGSLWVWRCQGRRFLERLHTNPAFDGRPPPPGVPSVDIVAFSPDGKLLAASLGIKELCFWEVDTWQRKPAMPLPTVALAFTPDSRQVAVSDPYGKVHLYDLKTRVKQLSLAGTPGQVQQVAFSPDGRKLVAAGGNGTSIVWDLESVSKDSTAASRMDRASRGARVLMGHKGRVQTAAFCADASTLATASFDGTVKLWDLAAPDGAPILQCALPAEMPPGVPAVLSEDLSELTVLGPECRANLLDTAARRQVGSFALPYSSRVVLSPNRQQFVVADYDGFELGDLVAADKRVALAPGGPLFNATFSPSGRTLATLNQNGDLMVWDVMSRRQRCHGNILAPEVPGEIRHQIAGNTALVFTSDDGLLVFGPVEEIRFNATNAEQTPFPGDNVGQVNRAICAPDSRLVAALRVVPDVMLIDAGTGQTRQVLHLPEVATDAAFSPDGRTLVTASTSGHLILWHVATGQELLMLQTPPGDILALRFAQDGRSLAALVRHIDAAVGSLYVWSVDASVSGEQGESERSRASPNGSSHK